MSDRFSLAVITLFILLLPFSAFTQEPNYIALVTDVQGSVQVKSANQTSLKRCMWGTQLHNGDNIQTQSDGRVSLLFSNGNVISIGPSSAMTISGRSAPAGAGEPIGSIEPELAADLSTIIVERDKEGGFDALAGLRSGSSDTEIVLTGPCNTAISDRRPHFSWFSKKSFDGYKITLFSSAGPVWSEEVQGTSLEYPKQRASLKNGHSYFWMVEGEELLENVPSKKVGFTVLPEEKVEEIAGYQLKMRNMFANESNTASYHTILGAYFEKAGLLREAVEAFKTVAEMNPDSPLPHEILGRLYKKIGLKDQAIAELQKALQLK